MAKPVTNLPASVRQRLLNYAREQKQPFDVILVRYGLERLLYRLSISRYRNRFILKGGVLVTLWIDDAQRVTRDIDFLGHGDDDAEQLKAAFADILSTDAEDGLTFDTEHLMAEPIREEVEYGGTRLKTTAALAGAKIPITIDIGFGDAVAPKADDMKYPSLLNMEDANIRAYPPATVIAEKFQAMVALGAINGRMKDYFDLWAIPRSLPIPEADLDAAIAATFARRNTEIPTNVPPGLSKAFSDLPDKIRQWEAYSRSIDFQGPSLEELSGAIWGLVGPSCRRLTGKGTKTWTAPTDNVGPK